MEEITVLVTTIRDKDNMVHYFGNGKSIKRYPGASEFIKTELQGNVPKGLDDLLNISAGRNIKDLKENSFLTECTFKMSYKI
ncbi:MAG TPA: hypothetical protein VJB35_01450 [Candidatus Nanoarchaeia archaeon]|nr:hypothetical protein [Candidatus Nanoarchaeia archaeon]